MKQALSPKALDALRALPLDGSPMGRAEVARAIGVAGRNLVRLTTRLLAEGAVRERPPLTPAARATSLALTAKGAKLIGATLAKRGSLAAAPARLPAPPKVPVIDTPRAVVVLDPETRETLPKARWENGKLIHPPNITPAEKPDRVSPDRWKWLTTIAAPRREAA